VLLLGFLAELKQKQLLLLNFFVANTITTAATTGIFYLVETIIAVITETFGPVSAQTAGPTEIFGPVKAKTATIEV